MQACRASSFRILATLAPLAVAAVAIAQSDSVAYVDSQGRQWRELWPTAGRTWFEVATKCPTDGVTRCSGSLGNLSLDGWIWATKEQVQEMMSELAPVAAKAGCVWGPEYTSQAGAVLSYFDALPPSEDLFVVSGWTATLPTDPALAGYAFTPYVALGGKSPSSNSVCLDFVSPRSSGSTTVGVWMFRPACEADLDQNGTIGPSDLATLLGSWGTNGPADLSGNGVVDAADLSLLLAAWGGC